MGTTGEAGDHVIGLSLHPGAVKTEITRYHEGVFSRIIQTLLTYCGKTAVEGAQTTLHCCLTDAAFLQPGGFYVDCELSETQGDQQGWYTVDQQEKLWNISNKMIGKKH